MYEMEGFRTRHWSSRSGSMCSTEVIAALVPIDASWPIRGPDLDDIGIQVYRRLRYQTQPTG
jgi:hypothetical protein